MKYSCEKCGKGFTQKSHYQSHQKRKTPCNEHIDHLKMIVDKEVKKVIHQLGLRPIEYFTDLYEFIQSYKGNIQLWLTAESGQESGYRQEALSKLFCGLGLLDKVCNYRPCKGNFNKMTIQTHESYRDIFYCDSTPIYIKGNSGDSSDITMISKTNPKDILIISSKSLTTETSGSLDIEKMSFYASKYIQEGYSIQYGFIVKNKQQTDAMISRTHSSSKELSDLYHQSIVIDWNDLHQSYHRFKNMFTSIPIDTLLTSTYQPLCLKMHQQLGVVKTIRMKETKNKILWGHIQRSGKSYIIGGTIIEDSKGKDECNYLIMTTAPNETIDQQTKVFQCIQLQDFNVVVLNGKNKQTELSKKNIIICSKQFLQSKLETDSTTNIPWLKKMKIDIRFLDESHHGGTTELAKKTLDYYGKNSFTVQITATYSKPIQDYNIPKDAWILWDLEDIKLCKEMNPIHIDRLIEKHGPEIKPILDSYSREHIIEEYSKYPELWILTDELKPEIVSSILKHTEENDYGWSTEACFLLKQSISSTSLTMKEEFQNEMESLKLWYRIFGKRDLFGIPDKDYSDNQVFMKRIERICKNPMIDSRFIGEGEFIHEPMIIMAFLPQNNIDSISNATIALLEKHRVIPDYIIISINSKTTDNPKQTIEDARVMARNSGKKSVLVLSGKQCSLGVSINNCDIVLLLNNNMGFDMIYQMMFRCMTEGHSKTCGFVVDMNIHRVIETSIIQYASLIKPDHHPREATKYILQERLINLNGDHWMQSFGNHSNKINHLCENVYTIYSSNTENALSHFLDRLRFKELLLSKDEQTLFNTMFSSSVPTSVQKKLIEKLLKDDNIQKGVEKIKVESDDSVDTYENVDTEDEDTSTPEKQVQYMDILKHIIPFICLLTIHQEESSFIEMFQLIETDPYIYNILIYQTRSWWGKNVDTLILKKLIQVYIKYMKDDKETNQIIRTVKELFVKNIGNSKQLSQLIDKYLVPQELEKKSNAEVSTPYLLRQEMLDKIPTDFWTSPKKVFEPCSGKGGFIVDIIDRFMTGLTFMIPDEKLRYKTIVQECLYFSDINPTNVFICKLLVDPYQEYSLNYNEGNTLEIDIKNKWNIDGFDAVIGNPPYENQNATGDNKLYLDFIEYALNHLLQHRYLLFIVPINIKNYITNQDKNRSYIKTFMDIQYLSMNTSNRYFPNISNYFSYFLLKTTPVTSCKTEVSYVRGKTIEHTVIDIHEKDNLPLCLSMEDIHLIHKVSNLIKPHWDTFDIKKALYTKTTKNKDKECTQRIRSTHIKSGDIQTTPDDEFKYPIIDKITKTNPYPGVFYYNNYRMSDYGESKIIMCSGGYLMPSYDPLGEYNLSDNMLYMLVNEEEYRGFCMLIDSMLIQYLNKVTMTDGIHGRGHVIQNIKKINLMDITTEEDVYTIFDITTTERSLMKKTI